MLDGGCGAAFGISADADRVGGRGYQAGLDRLFCACLFFRNVYICSVWGLAVPIAMYKQTTRR